MTLRYAGGLSHDHGDWYTRAQCRTADPRLFDGDRHPGETIDARNVRLKDTRRYYCDRCPVTAECAEAAWRHNDYGTLRAGRTRMSRPNTGVPAHKLSQIRSLAARRHTDREIGAVIGWHPETVRRARERYGIPAGNPRTRAQEGVMKPSTTTSTLQARAEALAYYGGFAVREWHTPGSPQAHAAAARRRTADAVDNPVPQAVDRRSA